MNKTLTAIKIQPIQQVNQSSIQGRVERIYDNNIIGWVQYKENISETVEIDVYEGDHHLATIQANQNTETIGLQRNLGNCGFVFPLPESYLTGERRSIKFVEHKQQQALTDSPFKLGHGVFDSTFKIQQGRLFIGKIQQRTADKIPYSLILSLDNQVFWQQQFQDGGWNEISIPLPDTVFDSKKHRVQIKVCDAQEKSLFVTLRVVKHDYLGFIESVDFKKIEGWLSNQEHSDLPVEIELAINGQRTIQAQCAIQRPDVKQDKNLSSDKVGFSIELPDSVGANTSTTLDIFIKGTDYKILTKAYVLTPKDIAIRSLISAAEHLNFVDNTQQNMTLSAAIQAKHNANIWVRQQIIAPLIKQLRQSSGLSANLQLSVKAIIQTPLIEKSTTVDIIIPVYQGYDETIACINSVLVAKNSTPRQIIVINDQSPDGRLGYKLQAMAKDKLFTLIENKKNLGFVATVNIGLALHKDRDVILLNADTEVYANWLDRLIDIAQQNNNIATVTPFSNNATICSFPKFNQDNPLNSTLKAAELDHWFAQLNDKKSVDLPTAVGFCMLIKREVLESIGYLDAKTWQRGYGEENDFCLRASALGWRHVLATDVFVKHHGSVSFAEEKTALIETNLAKLNQRYPDYAATVQRFIDQDSIARYRNPVIKKMIQQQSKKHILFIMHNLGGGAKTNADQMAMLLDQQGHAVLELVANTETQWELTDLSGTLRLKYQYPEDYSQLENDLRELGVWRIHFHQLIGFPAQIWQLPDTLSCAYDFTAHDFLPLCPRINMIDESGRYCGKSQYDTHKCQRCLNLNGLSHVQHVENLWQHYDQSIEQWRDQFKQRLANAENIFCPSKSTAKIYKKHYGLKNIHVKVHPEQPFTIQRPTFQSSGEIINIAIIGAIGEHKGSQLLLDCAKHALKEGLALRFIIIGFSDMDESFNKLDNVIVTGAYDNSQQLQAHIQDYACQVALFLSVWPETFCYTLTEALQNNLYPIALNYGAIAERIKKLKFGLILPAKSVAQEINKKLINIVDEISQTKKQITYKGVVYSDLLKEYYQLDHVK